MLIIVTVRVLLALISPVGAVRSSRFARSFLLRDASIDVGERRSKLVVHPKKATEKFLSWKTT
jgi:hypothetical protein